MTMGASSRAGSGSRSGSDDVPLPDSLNVELDAKKASQQFHPWKAFQKIECRPRSVNTANVGMSLTSSRILRGRQRR